MGTLFPRPAISVLLALLWVGLANDFDLNTAVMAAILAILIPLALRRYLPKLPQIKRPLLLLPYAALVLWDVLVSSIQVAKVILFMPNAKIKSAYVQIPVDLKSPQAVALLASTITMTPGTMTADISPDGSVLLVHCLHAESTDAVRDDIKSRYEQRLLRIFT